MRHLLLLVLLAIAPLTALAQTTDAPATVPQGTATDAPDPFAGLVTDNFDDTSHAIELLALSGDKQAEPTISALQDGNLFVAPDQTTLLIKTDSGFVNARTGEKVADVNEDDLAPVRVNNSVRRALESAMGTLTLFSADPAARASAAEAVFKSHDPAGLPALARAIAQEKDPAVRHAMEQARAARHNSPRPTPPRRTASPR